MDTARVRDSLSFACPVGDGPSLIFCIAALFRPSGETYREDSEAKVYNSAQKLKDGASPRKWVSDVRELLHEVLELGVTLSGLSAVSYSFGCYLSGAILFHKLYCHSVIPRAWSTLMIVPSS